MSTLICIEPARVRYAVTLTICALHSACFSVQQSGQKKNNTLRRTRAVPCTVRWPQWLHGIFRPTRGLRGGFTLPSACASTSGRGY
jgi:hypothetical protein